MKELSDILEKSLEINDVLVDKSQFVKIMDYIDHLIYWNKSINLTAHQSLIDIVEKDIVDTLKFISILDLHYNSIDPKFDYADIGCGAGFIGILLKVVYPELNISFIDKSNKRINFVRSCARQLDLRDIRYEVLSLNEDGAPLDLKFDIGMTRGTWGLKQYISISSRYLNDEGMLYMMAGKKDVLTEAENVNSVGINFKEYNIMPSAYNRKIYQVKF